ncbi:hypothetical protein DFA_11365 [Cavenderia fasciculata]|uniref:Transmembrane protein n=1 Tax=Cavenderia fasciculata TaxID=261658 RepID=F4QCG9_CACFS|nr:uncharacterized protein DFA_11365 [Cavenderia fasciculata]EGG13604.1 hypothetical protein DFA_11365 [Cavenderia fasciculata]|eukprot:XP_004350308.1 hypothetical protein DFA_11365 [Cavenderia fasciculata]
MGLCQLPFDLVLGIGSLVLSLLGIRGLWKRKKNYLFVFLWACVAMTFLHVISLSVVIILHHTKQKDSRFGYIPDIILDVFRTAYCLGLSFYTAYIRNTLEYKRPPAQLARI